MAQQQAAYTEGVTTHADIRAAINANATDAESRLVALELPVVAITDEAVTMTANTRYLGSIASFTADRNYTLPSGTAGDTIELFITTGDDAYELILLGASGVSINGGSAATEWSRLRISNEFVRFYCIATNDWWVEIDSRKESWGELIATSATSMTRDSHQKVLFNTESSNCSIASHANDRITVFRSGKYDIEMRWITASAVALTILTIFKNGVSVSSPDNRIAGTIISPVNGSTITNISGGVIVAKGIDLAADDYIEAVVYFNHPSVNPTASTADAYARPRLYVRESLP
jgi:hypothetical protein